MKAKNFSKNFKALILPSANRARLLIVLFVFLAVCLLSEFQLFHRFELVTYDYRCFLRGSRPTSPDIVVIEISDDSVAKIGRWPWDRDWHASLIKILGDLGAKAVVFDVIFSEKSSSQKDGVLAEAIRSNPNVYLSQVVEESPSQNKKEVLKSLPEFSDAAKGGGHINLYPDEDGVMRRIPLFMDVNGVKIPQLSFAVALDLFGTQAEEVIINKNSALVPVGTSTMIIPLDAGGNFILNWAGWWHETFKHYSYIDVVGSYALSQKGQKPLVPLQDLKGKICYVGTTASGLYDIRPTPLQPQYPAVGVNLTLLNNLLEKKFIFVFSFFQNTLILAALALCLFFIMRMQSYFKGAFLTFALALSYLVGAFCVFYYFGWWVNVVYPVILIVATYFSVNLYNQLAISIERTKLLKMATRDALTGLYNIGQFTLLLKAELITLAIHRNDRCMSVLMSDVDNFKITNDTYGHLTGDHVLRDVASAVRATCRALDVAARYGGEEFIVMLPGANEDEAWNVAEKIRKAINKKIYSHEKGDFSTSISIGIAQAQPGEKNVESLIGRADKALYEAKQTGKNKCVIYRSSSPEKNKTDKKNSS